MTQEDFAVQFRAEFPTLTQNVNGVDIVLDATAYEERIQEMAFHAFRQYQEAEAEATRVSLRTQARNYLETLEANEALLVTGIANLKGPTPPATIAALRNYVTQMAEMTLDHNRGFARLIHVLIDRGVIERDGA